MLDYKAIGRRIAFYRKKINMTQAVLSEKLNITESYVSQVERGTAKVSLSRLDEIADILCVDIASLLSNRVIDNDIAVNAEICEIIKSWDKKKTNFLINLLICADRQFKDTK